MIISKVPSSITYIALPINDLLLVHYGYVYMSKSVSDLNWIGTTFGSDLNWIYFERDPEVGRKPDQNWIGSAIFSVNPRRIRTKKRTDPVWIDPLFARVNVAYVLIEAKDVNNMFEVSEREKI